MKINIEVTPEEAAEFLQRVSARQMPVAEPQPQPRGSAFWDVLAGAPEPPAFQPQPTLPALPPAQEATAMLPAMPHEEMALLPPAPSTEIAPVVHGSRKKPVSVKLKLALFWLTVMARKAVANPIEVILVFVALGLLVLLVNPPKGSPPVAPQSSSGAGHPTYPIQRG